MRRVPAILAVGSVLAVTLAANGYSADEGTSGGQLPDSAQAGAAAPNRVSAYAWIRPEESVLVLTGPSTDYGYRIVHLDVREGDMVEKDQPLAELDVKRERAANLAVTEAQVHEAEVNADFSARDLARKEKLWQRPAPPISDLDLDNARQAAQLAKAQLEVARRQKAYAEIMLDEATIRAPAAGMVLRILKHEGEGFTPGQGLMELGRVARMEAVAEVFETDARFVKPGQDATFNSSALAGPVPGTVLRIMPKLDPIKLYQTSAAENTESRVVRVVIRLGNDPAVKTLTGLEGIVTIDTSNGSQGTDPQGSGDG